MTRLFDDAPPPASKPISTDPRHKAFIDFAFQSFREHKQATLVITGREAKAVAVVLKATMAHADEFSIDNLERFWLYFLSHASPFEMSEPIYWFCRKLNFWQSGANNGNGNGKKNGKDVAKDWLKKRLQK